MLRRAIDRVLGWLAKVVLLGFFRTIEVRGSHRVPRGRPLLVVANHFNGLVDPVALVVAIGRVPRFLAKATLWRNPLLRPLIGLAGLLPIHRRVDSGAAVGAANMSTFRAAHGLLRRRGTLAIFPEGTTHDLPRLAELRTGAARIALGARAEGIPGIVILPVGLSFEDKLALRSRLLMRIGEPIDLDRDAPAMLRGGPEGEDNHEAVDRLTARIEARLRAVTPDYATPRDAAALALAAEIALREPGGRGTAEVSLGDRENLAQQLAHRPRDVRERLRALVADYSLDLATLGLRDAELVAAYQPVKLLWHLVLTAAGLAVGALPAAAGVLANAVPYLITSEAGRLRRAPVSKGTTRFLVALVCFPAAWFGIAAWLVDGWWRVLLLGAALGFCGLVAVWCGEALVRVVRDWRGWRTTRERAGLLPAASARREEVAEEIRRAAAARPPTPAAERAHGPVDA